MKFHSLARCCGCIILALAVLCSGFLVYGVRLNFDPPLIRRYSVKSADISAPLTLVMLSDLHGCEHGAGNSALIEQVRKCEPDLIFMCGDMISSTHPTGEDILIIASLIRELSALAPIYYSLGNHELARIGSYWGRQLSEFREAGAVILEREYADIEIGGNSIRIGGIYTPNGANKKPNISSNTDFLTDLCGTDRFLILMEHRPAAFTDQILPAGFEPDLVLSGHLHGGHVIIPLLGPVWGANSGLFPKYSLGQFELKGSDLIVSAGLSTERHIIPRVNNPPEITKITLEPEK